MKRLGLIGGMSWESTTLYYQLLNRGVKQRLGGLHSAPIIMISVDFAPLERLMHTDNWDECASILAGHAANLEKAGADLILLCTNTMHRVAPAIVENISIPFLHICDVIGETFQKRGINKAGLLGTAPTMEADFYRDILQNRHNLQIIVPDSAERKEIDRIIFKELCLGATKPHSRAFYLETIERLAGNGAEAIILGCTEIGMLIKQHDTEIPLFDTTQLHVKAALEIILGN